jgi:excisionase family DNA binding protein
MQHNSQLRTKFSSSDRTILVHVAARKIGCSPRTIRRYIQKGILRAWRVGRRSWLVMLSDVERLRIQKVALW